MLDIEPLGLMTAGLSWSDDEASLAAGDLCRNQCRGYGPMPSARCSHTRTYGCFPNFSGLLWRALSFPWTCASMLFTSAGGAFNKRSNLLPVDGLPSPLLARRPALTPLTGVRTGDVVSPRLLPLCFMRRERLAGLGDEELESRPDLRVSGDVFKCFLLPARDLHPDTRTRQVGVPVPHVTRVACTRTVCQRVNAARDGAQLEPRCRCEVGLGGVGASRWKLRRRTDRCRRCHRTATCRSCWHRWARRSRSSCCSASVSARQKPPLFCSAWQRW